MQMAGSMVLAHMMAGCLMLLILAPGAKAEWGTHHHNDTKYCGGVTPRGSSAWTEAHRNEADDQETTVRGLYITIGASMCQFKNPTYIASIIGTTNAGTLFRLTHTLFDMTKGGFKLYLYNPTHWAHESGDTEMQQLLTQARNDWQVSWIGAEGKMAGTTIAGSSGWKHNANKSLYIDIDTRKMNAVTTPDYFVSVQSGHGHSRLIGGDSIYRATSTGFRIYVLHELGPITPEAAEKHEWTVGWLADQSEWGGASEPGLWHEHDVKIGATNDPVPWANIHFGENGHQFQHIPILITTAYSHTEEYHWHIGSSVVYNISTHGFATYLDGIAIKNLKDKYHVNYMAIELPYDADGTHDLTPAPTPMSANSLEKESGWGGVVAGVICVVALGAAGVGAFTVWKAKLGRTGVNISEMAGDGSEGTAEETSPLTATTDLTSSSSPVDDDSGVV